MGKKGEMGGRLATRRESADLLVACCAPLESQASFWVSGSNLVTRVPHPSLRPGPGTMGGGESKKGERERAQRAKENKSFVRLSPRLRQEPGTRQECSSPSR